MTTQTLSAKAQPKTNLNKSNHKYRGLIFSVSLFLLFNIVVLALTFYTSSSLDADAVGINLSGRQRMLSQRTAKVLLDIEFEAAQGQFNQKNNDELKKVVALFDTTLNAFKSGGTVLGGNEKPVYLAAISDPNAMKLVDDALDIWQPYKLLLAPVMTSKIIGDDLLSAATLYARSNNLKLLKLMNDLTTSLENQTKAKASKLKLIQTIALILSLILFANIVINALGKLRASDKELEKAQRETAEILHTVKEGLFLLDPQLNTGSQFSNAIHHILQHELNANMPFMPILQQLVAPEIYAATADYISLLFGNKVKENLVLSLNPLSQVKVQATKNAEARYLSFQFNRVVENKVVLHLLVTVQDVTDQVNLAEELSRLKGQTHINLDLLKVLATADVYQVRQFLNNTQAGLSALNTLLSHADKRNLDNQALANQCFRIIHSIKGEASAIGLNSIENLAHQFEEHLVALRSKTSWDNQEILSLPVMLSSMHAQIEQIMLITEVINQNVSSHALVEPVSISASVTANLGRLAEQVSIDQQKQVTLTCAINDFDQMDENIVNQLQKIAIQLLRNGIYHGIEKPSERIFKGKPSTGLITISGKQSDEGVIDFIIRDDGAGIVPSRIRSAMIASQRYTTDAANALGDNEIVRKLFESGFTTAQVADKNAGRGVGLDMVQAMVNELGGELKIDTKADVYTQFSVHLSNKTMPLINLESNEASL